MDAERELRFTHYRMFGLLGFACCCLVIYVVLLFSAQLVHGEEYLEQSVRTITRQERVEAARGILTDRNGQPLVGNRLSYTLTFDASLLQDGQDENQAILRLIQLCQSQGVSWVDNLPISKTAPFVYTLDSINDTQKSRFLKFLQYNSGKGSFLSQDLTIEDFSAQALSAAGLTPEALMGKLRAYFSLPTELSAQEARYVLGVQYELAVRKVVNTTAYVFAEDVDTELVTLLADGNYAGAKVGSSSLREIKTDSASHILGYVGRIFPEEYPTLKEQGYQMDDFVGKDGVEFAFEEYLRGIDGTRVVSTNSDGKITDVLYSTEPQPGSTVALTIDLDFQEKVEEILATTIDDMTAKDGIPRGAGAAVIGVGSGEVLALASYPDFSLATFNQDFKELEADPSQPLFNRATQGTYAPGSTFKPLTAVAALEEGLINTTQSIRDTGRWTYPGSTGDYAKCWIYPGSHGRVNVTEAITVSCNYFFAEMGYRLGMTKLNDYALAFGLGRSTGIEIGDDPGTLVEVKPGENLAPWAAFGQADYLFSPLQLANFTATLVGNGIHYPAHLLKSVKSYDNSQVLNTGVVAPENEVALSPSTVSAVKKGMYNLTTSGSLSSYFRNCVVDAGAKTGTAQITKKTKNNGVFIAFAPYDDPQIALAIVIEKGGSGAALASTAVSIINAYFTAAGENISITGEGQLLP